MLHPHARILAVLSIAATALLAPACGQPAAAELMSVYATQARTSRSTAAAAMAAAFGAGQFTAEDAINAARSRLDAGEDATDFVGAVLDMLQQVESSLPQGGEFELFYMRIGQLACSAAIMAHNNGRPKEAVTLVLAGPARWQTEAYWQRSPNHDALASMILDENARRSEAIARLRDRADLDGPALEVYRKLTGGAN